MPCHEFRPLFICAAFTMIQSSVIGPYHKYHYHDWTVTGQVLTTFIAITITDSTSHHSHHLRLSFAAQREAETLLESNFYQAFLDSPVCRAYLYEKYRDTQMLQEMQVMPSARSENATSPAPVSGALLTIPTELQSKLQQEPEHQPVRSRSHSLLMVVRLLS